MQKYAKYVRQYGVVCKIVDVIQGHILQILQVVTLIELFGASTRSTFNSVGVVKK